MANQGYKTVQLKSWWTMEKYNTGSSAWDSDTAIPAAGISEVAQNRIGTAQTVVMADGSIGRVTPSNTWNYDQIRLAFHKSVVGANLITQLNGYLADHTGVRMTTHTGDKFEGYIDAVNKVWAFTGDSQEYFIEVTFQQFDVDGSGAIG